MHTFDRDEVLEDPLEVQNICSSLVSITTISGNNEAELTRRIVALAHYSVQEYLTSDRIRQSKAKRCSMQDVACHEAIATGCLMYLLQFRGPGMYSEEVLQRFRLAHYSAEFWFEHARKTGERLQKTSQVAINLFSRDNPAYLLWIQNPEVIERLVKEGLGSECVTVPQPEGEWSPLAVAIFHGNTEMLGKLSTSCKSLLGTTSTTTQLHGELHVGFICNACFHVGE